MWVDMGVSVRVGVEMDVWVILEMMGCEGFWERVWIVCDEVVGDVGVEGLGRVVGSGGDGGEVVV